MSEDQKQMINRNIMFMVLFLIQLIWFIIILNNLIAISAEIQFLLTIASFIMVLYLVTKDESPAYRTSWIIVITLFPIFGGLLYFLIGNKKPTRSMSKKISWELSLHKDDMVDVPSAQDHLVKRDPRLAALSHYLNEYAHAPVYTNSKVKYFPNGESMMDTLVEDLKKAKKTIFIEFFIVEFGEMFDAIFDVLKEKVKEGVEVRFIYDDFGSITRLPKDYDKELEKIGIKTLKFNPVRPILSLVYNTRDHRKFIIIDSQIAYTGGLNIADEYINVKERFGYWKDNMIRIDGPASWNLTVLFLNMWNSFKKTDTSYRPCRNDELMLETKALMENESEVYEMGFVQPFGDSPLDKETIGENVYREILNNAVDYVYIYTPYLVISYELQTAMQLAAKRGVKIKLMTPGIPDKPMVFRLTRSYYRPLLEAGIEIYEFTPGFLHAKTFVADDKVATVGTINLDYRSLYLHFETSTMLYYHPEIQKIKEDFEASLEESKFITKSDIKKGLVGSIWDSLLRLTAPFV